MSEELVKALMTASGNSNLYQEDLSPRIYNLLLDELPLWGLFGTEQAQGPVHQYRVRASLPGAWVQGELSDSDFQSATHTLRQVDLKIVRTWGGVSSFAQGMTTRWVNMLSEAIETSVEGLANTYEMLFMYGNSAADTYQFKGVEAELLSHSTAKLDYTSGGNIYDVNAAITLTHLDNAINRVKSYRGGKNDRHVIVASREMISRISALQTRVTRDISTVTYEGGFEMESYRGVGLLPSDVVVPNSVTTSPTVTATAAAGGSLPDDEYFYGISSITLEGEQLIGVVDSATTATTNNSVNLTWTPDPNAKLYKIYRGLSATEANMELLTTIAAKTYDGNGNVNGSVASWKDDGTLTPLPSVHPLQAGMETMWVLNVSQNERGNRIMGAVSPLGDPIDQYISYVPLAITNGAFKYMIESFIALKVPYPTSNMIIRRAKLQ